MNPTAELLQPEVVELIHEGRYSELREALHHVPPADIADIFAHIEIGDTAKAFRFLQRDDAAEVFAYLSPENQEHLISELGTEGSARLIDAMEPDDRARLIDEMPAEVAQRIVASLTPENRRSTQAILGYPPKSVGRLMTPDYVRVRAEWTAGQTLDHVRRYGKDAETINFLYVVDEGGRLIDDLRLRQVLLAAPETPLESLMTRSFTSLRGDQPQDEAVAAMKKYDRFALPVVDSRGVLVGIVTFDDVADVAEAEVTEDIQKIGGVEALEESFRTVSVASLVRKRAPWLGLLFVSELLTANALAYFEDSIKRAAVLALFIPAIISSGGNSGSQASTLVIRALALRELELSDWWRVLRRELAVAGILGAIVGGLGFLRIGVWGLFGWWVEEVKDPGTHEVIGHRTTVQEHFELMGAAIAISLLGVVLWGSIMGSMLPFLLKKCGLDPAGSSTPFVATLVDVTGIVIYFTCAMLILRGTIL